MLKHAVARSLDYSIPGTDQVVRDERTKSGVQTLSLLTQNVKLKSNKVPHRKTGKNPCIGQVLCDNRLRGGPSAARSPP